MANLQMTNASDYRLGAGSADVLAGVDQGASGMVGGSPVQVTHNLTPFHSFQGFCGCSSAEPLALTGQSQVTIVIIESTEKMYSLQKAVRRTLNASGKVVRTLIVIEVLMTSHRSQVLYLFRLSLSPVPHIWR
jgi:hypothetical protein